MNYRYPVILGKQKLIFKSAKNKYDKNFFPNQKQKDKFDLYFGPKIYNENTLNNKSNYYPNYLNENKENLNIHNYININNYNFINRPFIEKQNKLENLPLNEQIKYSLQNIAKLYSQNDYFMKSKICNYYCAPFLDKNNFSINK